MEISEEVSIMDEHMCQFLEKNTLLVVGTKEMGTLAGGQRSLVV